MPPHSQILSLGKILFRFDLCSLSWVGGLVFCEYFWFLWVFVHDVFLFLVHIYVFFRSVFCVCFWFLNFHGVLRSYQCR